MNTIVTTSQMKNIDFRTINEFGTPARVLMEMAGKGSADAMVKILGAENILGVLVLCGRGNNGGDGAVIARWLKLYDFEVIVMVVGKGKMSPETTANLKQCTDLGIDVFDVPEDDQPEMLQSLLNSHMVLVDAIFGTGFKGSVSPEMDAIFQLVNDSGMEVVSIDIPSGLDGDTGTCETSIDAYLTLAIGSFKYGHFVGQNSDRCGEIALVDIGFPPQFMVDVRAGVLLEEYDLAPPERNRHGHKGDFGTGATALATGAALRSGAGYVFVMHRKELGDLYAQKLTEALCITIPENSDGIPDTAYILERLKEADSVLIGPGFGKDAYALKILEAVLQQCDKPVIVDADALNLIGANPELLKLVARSNVLLTPHWGEFCRLAGCAVQDLKEHYMQLLSGFVNKYKARVLLKSHFTMYKDDKYTILARSGNDGLATGGSGDVLAGIIATFMAQGMEKQLAAINASLLMGKTATMLAKKRETASILPSDIIEHLFVLEEE